MTMHPIEQRVQTFPPKSDMREMAECQVAEWDAMVQRIEALVPGDSAAEDMLREASALLGSITVNYGHVHSWLLAQHHMVYRHACRVFGRDQLLISKPNWTEQF